jgi:hypothetical protein
MRDLTFLHLHVYTPRKREEKKGKRLVKSLSIWLVLELVIFVNYVAAGV